MRQQYHFIQFARELGELNGKTATISTSPITSIITEPQPCQP